jgi:HEAT repeat protein
MDELNTLLGELAGGEDERAEKAAQKIPDYGEEGIAAVCGLLSDPDVDTRWWAVRALAEFPHGSATQHFIAALADEEPAVRQCAALALCRRPDDKAVPALISAMSDQDSLVVRLAANALIELGEPAVPTLVDIIMNEQPIALRLEAVRALAMIGDQRAISALVNVLDEDSALMEYWANEGLERMGVGMVYFEP